MFRRLVPLVLATTALLTVVALVVSGGRIDAAAPVVAVLLLLAGELARGRSTSASGSRPTSLAAVVAGGSAIRLAWRAQPGGYAGIFTTCWIMPPSIT